MPALIQYIYCLYDSSEIVNVLLSVIYIVIVFYQILLNTEDYPPSLRNFDIFIINYLAALSF